mgnify:FL=1
MYGSQAKIGFMLPSSCTVFEQEFLKVTLGLEGVIGCPTRLLLNGTDATGLTSMNEGIDLAAEQLATIDLDVIVYMCTSGSFMDGQDGNQSIKDRLSRITGCPNVTTTSESVVEAMSTLGIKRSTMLTPYNEDISSREVDFLASQGVHIIDYKFRDVEDNLDRGSLLPEESFHYASQLNFKEADGTFLSCANVRAIEIIDSLEAHTNKPVVTSAQATIWKALRMSGVDSPISGYGTLLLDH